MQLQKKFLPVGLQLSRSLLIQRVIRIGFEEQVLQPVHDRVDGEDGFPVFSKDVQTHITIWNRIKNNKKNTHFVYIKSVIKSYRGQCLDGKFWLHIWPSEVHEDMKVRSWNWSWPCHSGRSLHRARWSTGNWASHLDLWNNKIV